MTPMFTKARRLWRSFAGAWQAGFQKQTCVAEGLRQFGATRRGARLLLACGLVSGCGSISSERHGPLDQALSLVGLQRTGMPSASQDTANERSHAESNASNRIVLRLHAGRVLNVDTVGHSLPVVAKLYKLRNRFDFERLLYPVFQASGAAAGAALPAGISEVREVVLTPGERYETVEIAEPGVQYIGVVILFRDPAERRWRFVFDAGAAAATGITLGLHGCAASVAAGQPLDVPAELMRVAGVRCDAASM